MEIPICARAAFATARGSSTVSSLSAASSRTLISQASRPAPVGLPLVPRRGKATVRRTKKALKVSPEPTFFPDAAGTPDHIIFNPPAAAPSVYHTPFKFLPKSDPRRRANLSALFRDAPANANGAQSSASTAGQPGSNNTLPPEVTSVNNRAPVYNLTEADVAELRMLRASDPDTWSVLALARKFQTTPIFVMMCCRAPSDKKDKERAALERVKSRWGPRRTQAREDRKARREMLYRGEL